MREAFMAETLTFHKFEGLGNDFVVVDATGGEIQPQRARTICDRHFGVEQTEEGRACEGLRRASLCRDYEVALRNRMHPPTNLQLITALMANES